MTIFRASDAPFGAADSNTFVGSARSRRLAAEGGTRVHVYQVEFESGARTNWHVHSGSQWLFIVDGRMRVQSWGESPREVEAGDAVLFGPGEKHWHGAAPGSRGAHLAVNINATTEWLEPVSEQQYVAVK